MLQVLKLITMIKNLLSKFYLKHLSIWLLSCLFMVFFTQLVKAQTILNPGDISFTGFSANGTTENPKGVAFVTWVRLAKDTEIIISENGYHASGNLRWQKPWGRWKNTTNDFIEAGTVIILRNGSPRASVGTYTGYTAAGGSSSSFTLANSSGGHVFAYQGGTPPTASNGDVAFTGTPTALCALSYIANWLTSGNADSFTSNLPAAFAANAIYVNSAAAEYQVRTGKTLSQYKAEVKDASKWNLMGSNSVNFITTAFPVQAPTASGVTNTGNLQVGQTLTGSYSYADVNNTPESGSSFKWYRSDDATGTNKVAISSATSQTYILSTTDLNKHISFEITPRNTTEVKGVAVESALRGPVTAGALPVVLSGYSSTALNNGIRLDWQTISETNNQRFEVYRSGEDKYFVKIGQLTAKGSAATYNFTDKQPLPGYNYYKLIQIDLDGNKTEHGVKSEYFALKNAGIIIYPNPTQQKATVTFSAQQYNTLSLVSANGKNLQMLQINSTQTEIVLDLSVYPKGTYFIKLIGKDTSEVKKLVRN